ncbi:TPA: phage protein Gp27 family protein [Serratia marcescens]
MARPSILDKLPEDVRSALHAELLRTHFTDYDSMVFWLSERGYDISRSAIQRYAVKHKEEILGLNEESKFHQAQLRLASLNVAAVISPQKDIGSLKNDAEEILKWALFGY